MRLKCGRNESFLVNSSDTATKQDAVGIFFNSKNLEEASTDL